MWPNLHDLQSALFFYGKVEQFLQRQWKAAAAGCSLGRAKAFAGAGKIHTRMYWGNILGCIAGTILMVLQNH